MANKQGSTPARTIYYSNSPSSNASSNNALINELNKDIKLRMTRSNTIIANAKVVFHGPMGNAVYGGNQWGAMLESILASSIQTFLSRVAGEVTPEGYRVEPIGFHVDLKVHQPAVAASVLTFQVRK